MRTGSTQVRVIYDQAAPFRQDGDGSPVARRSVFVEVGWRIRWAKVILPLMWAASPMQHSIQDAEHEDKVGAVQGR